MLALLLARFSFPSLTCCTMHAHANNACVRNTWMRDTRAALSLHILIVIANRYISCVHSTCMRATRAWRAYASWRVCVCACVFFLVAHLSSGADAHSRCHTPARPTALHLAAVGGHVAVARLLRSCAPSTCSKDSSSPGNRAWGEDGKEATLALDRARDGRELTPLQVVPCAS